jgi:hypothetical protein
MVEAIKVNGGIWYRLPGTELDILVKTLGPHIIWRKENGTGWDLGSVREYVKYREHSSKNQGFCVAREPEYLSSARAVRHNEGGGRHGIGQGGAAGGYAASDWLQH